MHIFSRDCRAFYGLERLWGNAERIAFAGYVALEVRGQWARRTEGGETERGALLTRVAVCEGQNRAYLLDSWIHTPAAETYGYVVQLETILDTFRCD